MALQLRPIVHAGLSHLDRIVGNVIPGLSANETLSDDEALTRYALLHRGNARAIADFAATNAPPGVNPLQAAHDYETAMEQKIKERLK